MDFEDESLDYIYIDATHTTVAIKNDLDAWYPKLKKYGMIAGHDFTHDEVALGVVQWTQKRTLNHFYIMAYPLGFWVSDIMDYSDWWVYKI